MAASVLMPKIEARIMLKDGLEALETGKLHKALLIVFKKGQDLEVSPVTKT